jgi:hypothetical protein
MLGSPSPLSLAQTLRPPMEQGGGADEIRTGLQRHTAGSLGVFQLVDGGEMALEERRIGERPQMFSGLQFGRIRRQKEQVGAIRFPETAGG